MRVRGSAGAIVCAHYVYTHHVAFILLFLHAGADPRARNRDGHSVVEVVTAASPPFPSTVVDALLIAVSRLEAQETESKTSSSFPPPIVSVQPIEVGSTVGVVGKRPKGGARISQQKGAGKKKQRTVSRAKPRKRMVVTLKKKKK